MDERQPEYAFLRQAPLFRSLPSEALESLYSRGEMLRCGPGKVIFEEGSPGFDLFVVKSGVVEVLKTGGEQPKVVSYLSAGDCVGEMSIITGLLRSATVRAQGPAEVFRIRGEIFEQVLNRYPGVALSLAKTLAYRLQVANQVLQSMGGSGQATKTGAGQLSGDLEFFEITEVCQSLTQSSRTGMLRVDVGKKKDLWLYFEEGRILYAKMGDLAGRDAVLCIFRRRFKGSFEFESTEKQVIEDQDPIRESPLTLFLEGARQRDEIEELRTKLPEENHIFTCSGQFPWSEPDPTPVEGLSDWHPTSDAELDLAKKVWAAMAVGLTLGDILTEFLAKEHSVMMMIVALRRAKRVR